MELRTAFGMELDLPFLLSQSVREQTAAELTFQARWYRIKCHKIGTYLQYFKQLFSVQSFNFHISKHRNCI